MTDLIKQKIESIHQEKSALKRFPTLSLEMELRNAGFTDDDFERLKHDQDVICGKTLNQNYYELIKNRIIKTDKWSLRLSKPKAIR